MIWLERVPLTRKQAENSWVNIVCELAFKMSLFVTALTYNSITKSYSALCSCEDESQLQNSNRNFKNSTVQTSSDLEEMWLKKVIRWVYMKILLKMETANNIKKLSAGSNQAEGLLFVVFLKIISSPVLFNTSINDIS